MSISCKDCIYAEVEAEAGDTFSYVNPYGEVIERQHSQLILTCRHSPPIAGSWPNVSEGDWCGQFTARS